MKYPEILQAKFLERPNRFIAKVDTESGIETVHVKNTGRCKELLLPHVPVILAKGDNPGRKSLSSILTDDYWVYKIPDAIISNKLSFYNLFSAS